MDTKIRRRLNKMFSRWKDSFSEDVDYGFSPYEDFYDTLYLSRPDADIIDLGKELIIKIDLPGIKKEDIIINLDEEIADIKAFKKEEFEEREKDYYLIERSSRGYHRRMKLPEQIVPEEANAKFENGILEIRAPKASIQRSMLKID